MLLIAVELSHAATRSRGGEEKPKLELVDHYLFPCSYLLEFGFRFQTAHPASPEDQIQAAAVKAGCAWCPYFDAGAYEKLGTVIR